MTRRDEEEDARGWSVVFKLDEDGTADQPAVQIIKPQPKKLDISNERTIIDRALTGEIARQLAAKGLRPDDTTLPPHERSSMRDTDPEQPFHTEDSLSFNEPTAPHRLVEKTQVDAHALMDPETDTSEVPAQDDDELLESPPLPVHLLKELGPVGEPQRQDELTVLDLAAQLGLSPEKLGAELERPAGAPAQPAHPVPKIIETPIAEIVADDEDALAGHPAFKNAPPKRTPGRRGETMLQHLPRMLLVTETTAKLIPILIVVFVALATVGVTVFLFEGIGGSDTEHVMLRFLPLAGAQAAPPDQYAPAPMFTLETEPEGLLVVLDRKILGATPLTFEMPVRGDRVGIELTSPYFETYITQVRSEAGEVRVRAKLIRKR